MANSYLRGNDIICVVLINVGCVSNVRFNLINARKAGDLM